MKCDIMYSNIVFVFFNWIFFLSSTWTNVISSNLTTVFLLFRHFWLVQRRRLKFKTGDVWCPLPLDDFRTLGKLLCLKITFHKNILSLEYFPAEEITLNNIIWERILGDTSAIFYQLVIDLSKHLPSYFYENL